MFNFLRLMFVERLISHMVSHRPYKCNVTTCGKEFKFKAHLVRHCATSHGTPMRSGSPRPIMKTRAAFYYNVVPSLRISRRLCAEVLNLKYAARFPFIPINLATFKQECTVRLSTLLIFAHVFCFICVCLDSTRFAKGVSPLPRMRSKIGGKVVDVSHRLGTPMMPKPEWLIAMPKDKLPQPARLAFPPTPIEGLIVVCGYFLYWLY